MSVTLPGKPRPATSARSNSPTSSIRRFTGDWSHLLTPTLAASSPDGGPCADGRGTLLQCPSSIQRRHRRRDDWHISVRALVRNQLQVHHHGRRHVARRFADEVSMMTLRSLRPGRLCAALLAVLLCIAAGATQTRRAWCSARSTPSEVVSELPAGVQDLEIGARLRPEARARSPKAKSKRRRQERRQPKSVKLPTPCASPAPPSAVSTEDLAKRRCRPAASLPGGITISLTRHLDGRHLAHRQRHRSTRAPGYPDAQAST